MNVSKQETLKYYGAFMLPSVANGIGFDEGDFINLVIYGTLCTTSIMVNISLLFSTITRRNSDAKCERGLFHSHLAFANLVYTFKIQLEILYSHPREWPNGLCQLSSAGRVFGLYLSGYITTVMYVNRYMIVAKPLKVVQASKPTKETRKMLITAYLAACVCCLSHGVISHVEYSPPREKLCVIYPTGSSSGQKLTSLAIRIMLTYIIPCGTILWYHIKERKYMVADVEFTNGSSIPNGLMNKEKCQLVKGNLQKQTILQICIFVISYTGYYTLGLWEILNEESFRDSPLKLRRTLYLTCLLKPCLDGVLIKYLEN